MKHYHILSISLLCLCGMLSCKKFVAIQPSPQLIQTAAVFSNDNTAIAAVDGLYTQMRAASPSYANGGLSIFTGLTSDEIYNTTSNTIYTPFFNNAVPSNNSTISGIFWQTPYNVIYRSNAILEGLSTTSKVTDSVKSQLTGEAEVVRALTYFCLTNLYGAVPLITSTDYTQNASLGRSSSLLIYSQIISDLKDAETKLSANYPSSGKVRPNKMTAAALLARAYLYQKDWADAEGQASLVINSNLYSLVPDLNSVFLINSPETIWEMTSPNETRNTAEAQAFIPSSPSVKPAFAVSSFLLNAFEPGDMRMSDWLKANKVGGNIYYYPFKFKNRSTTSITEYDIVFRLSELYLIRAEAIIQQSAARISEAVNDINVIRLRAGLMPLSSSLSQTQALAATMQENRIEFFSEWGHRWLDLKRTGQIDSVLSTEKSGWQSYDALYPIPYSQLQYDSKLTQNQGY